MIDNEGIHKFKPLLNTVALRYPPEMRCGY
jgi:hypothetical protein